MKILYLPLDERPCNYHFAPRIASGSGLEVICPEPTALGDKKRPADFGLIEKFLIDNAACADGIVLSLDMLLYGGIVPSRLHHLDEDELCHRLSVVDRIKEINPKVKIYAFALIMRCPKYSSADEEPDYYEYCGEEIFRTGQVKHKLALGLMGTTEAERLLREYDAKVGDNLQDFETRRELNRSMLIRTIERLHKTIDFLIIPQDDSAEFGYTSMDREAIKAEIRERGFDDVAMYPGADEVGMTLLARAACDSVGRKLKIHPIFAHENAPGVTPLYEDRPLGKTLPHQIESAGCCLTDTPDDADIILYMNYPARDPVEVWQPASLGYAERHLDEFCHSIGRSVKEGRVVALADGAYCNGGDRELMVRIDREIGVFSLSAYAGWNTSSNTLGTVICQAVFVALFGDSPSQKRFLAERIMEDVGYCGFVRAKVTSEILPGIGFDYFNAGERDGQVADIVRGELLDFASKNFPKISNSYDIRVCQMPWKRMFEVDLALVEK